MPADDETHLGQPDSAARSSFDDETRVVGTPPPAAGAYFETGDAFGSRYRIIKQLGAGGMGVVYQAWDEVLNVVVALKIIRPDTVSNPEAAREIERRFKRELLLARKVTHKHVVRIHDLGDVNGTKYITMSFVEGEDLVATLRREGKLPIARVVHLAKQVASGLEAAHDAGVVHRDLKPANIMVDTEDQALIMDFGIALSAGDPRARMAAIASRVDTDQTMLVSGTTVAGNSIGQGAIIGTLDYMSPEQSKGEPVDHRSDIYTFGLILTDLLLGPRSVPAGKTAWDALTDRITHPPKPIAARNPDVPTPFDAVITKCLQLAPADRFQTTRELVQALERLDDRGHLIPQPRRFTARMGVAAAVVIGMLLGVTWWAARGGAPAAPREPVTVLIADFVNRANDPVFSGLIEQALAVGVEGAGFISAYPRRDALRLAGQLKPGGTLDDAAAKLITLREDIDVIIGGTIESKGSAYSLSVHVTRPSADPAAQDAVILNWSTVAAGRDQVLEAVGQIATQVRDALGDTTADNSGGDAETFTAGSLESAKAYAEAQELQWAGRSQEAIAAYKRTLALDPNFGRAHAGLAALYFNSSRPQEAEASYLAALGHLDRMTEREKYRTRGGYYLFKRSNDKARQEFESLVKDFPADSSGLANLAVAHFYLRDMKSAREFGQQASDFYPKNVIRKNNVALFAMYSGDFEAAERTANEALALNPAYPKAFVAIALSQLALGRNAEAAATYERLGAIDSGGARSFAASGRIDLALYEGRPQDALQLLDAALAIDRAAKDDSAYARRLTVKAGILAEQGRGVLAVEAATEAANLDKDEGTQYLAGLALIAARNSPAALEIAVALDNQLEDEPRIHGALLRGEAALAAGRAREAKEAFEAAQKLDDTWLGRYGLGRAYLARRAYPEAVQEFDRCLTRKGEATAVFLDELPTYRLMPRVEAFLAQARGAMAAK
ncbi:MAG: protein kinase [Acidobacteriota bacterium]|nr:protein kinase [Acidobacteriota bacterium]